MFDIVSKLQNEIHANSTKNKPYVTLSYAQSIDGSIANYDKSPLQLSNAISLQLTHYLRCIHSAILVGVGTVLSDNPRLTVRLVDTNGRFPIRNPIPIVIDKHLQIPLDCNLVKSSDIKPIIVTNNRNLGDKDFIFKSNQLMELGCEIHSVDAIDKEGNVDLVNVLQIFQYRFDSIMVEGGGKIINSCLASSKLIDSIIVTISPCFVGGYSISQSNGIHKKLQNVKVYNFDSDFILVSNNK